MKNAKEMNAITTAVLEERAKAREAKNVEYVENEIAPLIEARASKGYSSVTVAVTMNVDRDCIAKIFKENGYTVENSKLYGNLLVKW